MKETSFYEPPKIELLKLNAADILTTSPNEDEWSDDNVRDEGWL